MTDAKLIKTIVFEKFSVRNFRLNHYVKLHRNLGKETGFLFL